MATTTATKFRTTRNRLTAYSFACGYIETRVSGSIETRFWHEGACYHVRQFDYSKGYAVPVFWESFDTITEARKFFDRQPGNLVRG